MLTPSRLSVPSSVVSHRVAYQTRKARSVKHVVVHSETELVLAQMRRRQKAQGQRAEVGATERTTCVACRLLGDIGHNEKRTTDRLYAERGDRHRLGVVQHGRGEDNRLVRVRGRRKSDKEGKERSKGGKLASPNVEASRIGLGQVGLGMGCGYWTRSDDGMGFRMS